MWFMVLIWELTPPEDSPRAGGEKRSARCSDAAVYSGDPVTSLFIGPGLLSGCKITYHSHVCQSYWQNEPAQEAQRTRTPREASPVCWWLSPCAGDVSWDSKRSVLTHAVSYCNVTRWSSKYFTDPCDFSGLIRVSIFCSFFFSFPRSTDTNNKESYLANWETPASVLQLHQSAPTWTTAEAQCIKNNAWQSQRNNGATNKMPKNKIWWKPRRQK